MGMTPEESEKERKLAEIAAKYGFEKAPAGYWAERERKTEPGKAPEPAKTNPNRRENELMMNLLILRNGLASYSQAVQERCKEAGPNVWRDLRLMMKLVDRVQDALLDTMPEARRDYYRAYARTGRYVLEMQRPVRKAREILISDMLLGALVDAAMENECVLCIREGRDIERCLIREALLQVAVPSRIREKDGYAPCEYRETAGQLLHGEMLTV